MTQRASSSERDAANRRRAPRAVLPTLFTLTILALVVIRLVSAAGLSQATTAIVDTRVNQATTADQQEPTLAVDPNNPNNLLAAAKDWRTGPKQVWHYRSTDGGRSWADGHLDISSELPNQSDPVIRFNSHGMAYMSVLGYNQNDFSVGGLFVSQSADTGLNWQRPVLVSANSDKVFNDKEWIAVDNSGNPATDGNLYVTWTLFTQTSPGKERGDIVLSRSTDGGKTFSPRKVVSLPEQSNTQGSFLVVGQGGELYVLYFNGKGGSEAGDVEDAGAGMDVPSATEIQPAGSAGLFVARSTDGGQTFKVAKATDVTPPPSPLPGSNFRVFILPSLAVDPQGGALYVTWNDYASGNSDVMLVRSDDSGQTWSAPKRVNDDPATPRRDQFFPTATVGSDGTLHMLWLDRRDDPANLKFAPYYASSTDGGKTFSKNVPVGRALSDPRTGFEGVLIGDYLALDVSRDGGRVYAAWVDTRNGDQDIYFSAFNSVSGPPAGLSVATQSRPAPMSVPSPQPLTGFSDEGFLRKWEYADRPVLTGRSSRPWVWGPIGFAAASEPYAQGKAGKRDVEYFDKARMEINNPGANRKSAGFVTNGLLVVELVSGRVQTGDAQFEAQRPPAQIPVAGDTNSLDALTYASLAPVASLNGDRRSGDRTGQDITGVLDSGGHVRDDGQRASSIKIARYEPTIGHNIPDVFWTFMNSTGPTYNGRFQTYKEGALLNWVSDLGYPITEPYWTNVKIAGVSKWVLVQAFQRRVLTYVADNPPGWQVEMGNVGRHYYDWRYRQSGQ